MTIESVVNPTKGAKMKELITKVEIVSVVIQTKTSKRLSFCPQNIEADNRIKNPDPVIRPLSLSVNSSVVIDTMLQAVVKNRNKKNVLKKDFLLNEMPVISLHTTHKYTP